MWTLFKRRTAQLIHTNDPLPLDLETLKHGATNHTDMMDENRSIFPVTPCLSNVPSSSPHRRVQTTLDCGFNGGDADFPRISFINTTATVPLTWSDGENEQK